MSTIRSVTIAAVILALNMAGTFSALEMIHVEHRKIEASQAEIISLIHTAHQETLTRNDSLSERVDAVERAVEDLQHELALRRDSRK